MAEEMVPWRQSDSLRIGHAEREEVARRLQTAYAEGRLDESELRERLDATYAAKTVAELRPLTVDLPGGVPASLAPPRPPARPRSRVPTGMRVAWAVWATVVGVNVLLWLLVSATADDEVYPWPIWVAVPWGGGLLVGTVATYVARSGNRR